MDRRKFGQSVLTAGALGTLASIAKGDPAIKFRPGTEYIYKAEANEHIVSTLLLDDDLLIATNRAVFLIHYKK